MTTLIKDIENYNLVNPFSNKILYKRILIPCNKLNTDIYLNIKNLLKKDCEGKCIKYGYISKIYRILEYSENEIDINNLDCSVFYNVKFSARLCLPINNTIIIARISTINKQLFVAENGPIKNMVKLSNIDYDNFKLDNERNIIIKKQNKKLVLGMYVKVLIKAKKMNNNDDKIGTLCYLVDIAKQTEINNFYEKKNRTEDVFDITNDEYNSEEDEDEDNNTDNLNDDNQEKLNQPVIDNDDDDETEDSQKKNFILI
jgi:DNA-directed RNA polymerase subunit E'/Rpb7